MLGALNERMLALAGELADGVLLNYLPAAAVPWCIEQVRAGEAAAGRPRGSCTVYAYVHVGVCDPDGARDAARRDLFSYAVVPAYARAFARAGFADEVDGVRSAHAARDREGALAAISDRMIDAIDICGDADRVATAVQEYRDAGVQVPVIMPLPWAEDRRAVIDATVRSDGGRLMQLDGAVVVVTGAGSGIGAALCERFAVEASAVVAVGPRRRCSGAHGAADRGGHPERGTRGVVGRLRRGGPRRGEPCRRIGARATRPASTSTAPTPASRPAPGSKRPMSSGSGSGPSTSWPTCTRCGR